MIAILALPLYILFNVLMYKSLIRWLKACSEFFDNKFLKKLILVIHIILASSLLVGALLPSSRIRHTLQFMGNYWLGFMIYALMVTISALIAWFILEKTLFKKDPKISVSKFHIAFGFFAISLVLGVSIYGVINARIIHTTKYNVTIDKEISSIKDLKIVMVADLHLGYNIGYVQMQKMAKKINAQNPDIVIIAGDIFDNEYDAINNPKKVIEAFKSIKSKYGIYAVYGNHDVSEKVLAGFTFNYDVKKESDIRMDKLLKDSNIKLLRDNYILIDNSIYLYGRPDKSKVGRGIDVRKSAKEIVASLDTSKPIIVVDHQPLELNELSESGVDLDLSGHTHDGQIFPINLFEHLKFDNVCGMKKYGDMTSIVTSGVGVYGPNMRVGTIAEITSINVHFGN